MSLVYRFIDDHNLYYVLTNAYKRLLWNFATMLLLTKAHMGMFIDKSIVIEVNGQGYGTIN